ncbi:RNA-guided endonuclease InsQ/TnpB family protein [Virgisporangium aurantiacum]|uniref:RNA-guided endonuclease InsQ/TnpB family protein n=1 Tax=Virgisporangium aurantiacum TaxID=175570 RepID=UPI001951FEEC|nr:RNA-guided endonuclease TnpB family protein [Virgisporangium aurantiacum]
MRRRYKFLLRPTSKQATALAACVEDHRLLYNAALEERREAWRRARKGILYGSQSKQLKDIRSADPQGQGRWSFSSQQATLRRLDRAFQAFFRRIKTGRKPGYPRFKGGGRFDTVEWPKDGDGCRWNSTSDSAARSDRTRVYLRGIGHVRVHAHRKIAGTVKTVSAKREGRRWYLVLSCDHVPADPLPPAGSTVGIDMGVASFLTTSEGAQVPNPRPGRCSAGRLTAAQQALARCARYSNRRRRIVARVAALHAAVRRRRLDHAHKTAVWLVRNHDLIFHEELRITNMTRSAAGTLEEPGTNVAQKSGLNRSILDAGWGVFLAVLHAKAESAGRVIVGVDPRNTSRTCPDCGHCAAGNRVTQASFVCLACGFARHADIVAATNILRAGLALQT